jgi:hypothetical protein
MYKTIQKRITRITKEATLESEFLKVLRDPSDYRKEEMAFMLLTHLASLMGGHQA